MRSHNIPKHFNLLMHVMSRSMLYTVQQTGMWSYSDSVVPRPVEEISSLETCECKMTDEVATRATRNFYVEENGDPLRRQDPPQQTPTQQQ